MLRRARLGKHDTRSSRARILLDYFGPTLVWACDITHDQSLPSEKKYSYMLTLKSQISTALSLTQAKSVADEGHQQTSFTDFWKKTKKIIINQRRSHTVWRKTRMQSSSRRPSTLNLFQFQTHCRRDKGHDRLWLVLMPKSNAPVSTATQKSIG